MNLSIQRDVVVVGGGGDDDDGKSGRFKKQHFRYLESILFCGGIGNGGMLIRKRDVLFWTGFPKLRNK